MVKTGSEAPGFFQGVRAVFAGLGRLIREPDLRRLALLPIALTGLLYLCAFAGGIFFADDVLGWIWTQPAEGWLRYLWWVVLVVAFLLLVVVSLMVFLAVTFAVAGPFYEKIAVQILTHHRVPLQGLSLARSIGIEIAWAVSFALPAVALAVLSWLPGVGIAFALGSVLLSSLGLAVSALGPALSATGRGYRDRWALCRRALPMLLGLAAVLCAALWVPVLGLVVLPSAVIGATELMAPRWEILSRA